MEQELAVINAELQMLAQDEQEQILDAMFAEYMQAMMALSYPEFYNDEFYTYA